MEIVQKKLTGEKKILLNIQESEALLRGESMMTAAFRTITSECKKANSGVDIDINSEKLKEFVDKAMKDAEDNMSFEERSLMNLYYKINNLVKTFNSSAVYGHMHLKREKVELMTKELEEIVLAFKFYVGAYEEEC